MNIFINKKSLILFFLLVFSVNYLYATGKHVKISNKIISKYNRELKRQKKLLLVGEGGSYMGDIQDIGFSYITYEKMDLDQARRLYIEVTEGYLSRFNENEEVRPYMHTYPFTIDNLQVMLAFENEKREYREEGEIALMCVLRGFLCFEGYDHEKKKFYRIHHEPYSTAREIAQKDLTPLSAK